MFVIRDIENTKLGTSIYLKMAEGKLAIESTNYPGEVNFVMIPEKDYQAMKERIKAFPPGKVGLIVVEETFFQEATLKHYKQLLQLQEHNLVFPLKEVEDVEGIPPIFGAVFWVEKKEEFDREPIS